MRGDAPNSTGLPAGSHPVSLRHEGRERPYLLHVPPGALVGPVPLLLELHGRGIDPVSFDRWTGFRHLADRAGFVVALPSAVGEIWNDGRFPEVAREGPRDAAQLVALVEDACAHLPIDTRRIYVVGMSNGATMAARLACEQAELIAAFAQVAGTAAVGVAAGHRPACPVPILQIHGTGDDTAPYGGGQRRGLRARLMIRKAAGPSVGVDDWTRFWVEANEAHEGPRIEALPPDTVVRRWRCTSSASDVVFYRVEGGGHTWPGNSQPLPRLLFGRTSHAFDATKVIWNFLAAHHREA